MTNRKFRESVLRKLDNAISRNPLSQLGILVICIVVCYVIGVILAGISNGIGSGFSGEQLNRIMELLMDPGAFVGSDMETSGHGIPVAVSWFISILGVVVFTAMTITMLGNIVGNIDDIHGIGGILRYFGV